MLIACAVTVQSNSTSEQQPRQTITQNPASTSPELAEAEKLNKDFLSLYAQSKYDEALPIAKRVLELREKALGTEHQLVATSLANLGTLYLERKEPAAARQPFQRALMIYEKKLGADHPATLTAAENLALVFSTQKEYDKAEEQYRRVVAVREKGAGQNSKSVAVLWLKLGYLAQLKRKETDAIENYDRALDIYESLTQPLSEADIKMLESYECATTVLKRSDGSPATHSRLASLLNTPRNISPFEHKSKIKENNLTTGVLNGTAIRKPVPSYPAEAKRDRASGTILVAVVIDPRGKVISATPKCGGHPALQRSAVEAARGWVFAPKLLSGQSVEVKGSIVFTFTLQ